jgi:flotillin
MLTQFFIPIIVVGVVLALISAMALFSRNYLKVPPNAVAVLSGRRRKTADGKVVGYRVVNGAATFRFPLLEQVDYLSLNVFTIPLEIKRA